MSKHTPGPWKVQTDDKGFYWIDKITKDGGFSICNCGTAKNAEANARLIASAPELLEMCKKTLPFMHDEYDGCSTHIQGVQAIKQLEQAIAKAEQGK